MSARLDLEETLQVVGLSHHTAPVALRERLAFQATEQPRALKLLLSRGFREAVVLSTCNRVEIYAIATEENNAGAAARIRAFLAEYHRLPEIQFESKLYEHQGNAAARHLFEVAASLDSQILGEPEILGQVKEAYRSSDEVGACGPTLRAVFERAFFLAKLARSEGGIGRSPTSISSAAVMLAKKVFDLKKSKILMIGTGEMSAGIARALRAAGATEILVLSRTEDRAREFARREGVSRGKIQDLAQHLANVDVALISAASPRYIIKPSHIQIAMKQRHARKLCLIDISVPRNVDPAAREIDGVFLYDIDNLEEVARDGRQEREAMAFKWRPYLAEEARKLLHSLREQKNNDTSRRLVAHLKSLRQEAQTQIPSAKLSASASNELRRALERMQGQLLHRPLETLKQAAREGNSIEVNAWIARLFKL